MIILGMETSGRVGSLALMRDGRVLEERFMPELFQRHAQSLILEIQALLRSWRVAPANLGAVAVSAGPGGFTSLRVGVTCAKTLAYATGASLIAIDTFQAIAENFPLEPRIAVVADAQRRGVMLGAFERTPTGRMERQADYTLIPKHDLPAKIGPRTLLAGWGVDALNLHFEKNQENPGFHLAPLAKRTPRAGIIARLGAPRLHLGIQDDPMTLEPQYAQRSAAEEQWDQRANPLT